VGGDADHLVVAAYLRRRIPPRPRSIIEPIAPRAPPPRSSATPESHRSRPAAKGATARHAGLLECRGWRSAIDKQLVDRGPGEKAGVILTRHAHHDAHAMVERLKNDAA
jgi:hypothetical protein